MAKATDTITLTAVRDIESVTWYYQLKAGTAAPAKPTASPPPSPWQTSEPSYTAGDTKYLFVVERTVYTDGTFEYTTPTMSSSYEAAKLAYVEAQNAKKTATNFMSADSLGIMVADMRTSSSQTPSNPRGRNVLIDNDSVDIRKGSDVLASFGESTVIGQACQFRRKHCDWTGRRMASEDKLRGNGIRLWGNSLYLSHSRKDPLGEHGSERLLLCRRLLSKSCG